VAPEHYQDPAYVPAAGVIDGVELFDADFFGFTPREAELMDPQLRLFLEVCWQACESAGYNPQGYPGRIGVYGGSAATTYFIQNLLPNPSVITDTGGLAVKLLNDKDFLTTHVSYRLNLRGPSVAVQTACSTGLVAVHLAAQAVLNGECEMALAGGSTLTFPHRVGYMFREGSIGSPDGHCRAFDAKALGTVAGNGAAVVLLKRLSDALNDGDTVHAVLLATALNNDGSGKAGFTAPSVESQMQVVGEALAIAGVDPETVGLVEAHGSGTPLGDPIEVQALTGAFRASTARKGFCALGSIKTNIGHTDTAAGVAGLIKVVQSLKHRQIPPTLHFEQPNPRLELEESPFYVPTALRDWPAPDGAPRRGTVNSLGIGGTNAHVVVEEAPEPAPTTPSRPWQLVLLSARTAPALETAAGHLASWLGSHADADLADVAHTLRVGRRVFRHRRALVCRDGEEAQALLSAADPGRVLTADSGAGTEGMTAAFLLPGVGDHYPGMGAGLYKSEPAFQKAIDRCAELLKPHLGLDLREVLFPGGTENAPSGPPGGAKPNDLRRLLAPQATDEPTVRLNRTALAHPAVFAVAYALARLWMEWGIKPKALIGYSLGEYVAACLAGVLSLEDALRLVAARARLIDALPEGAMLAVPLPAAELEAEISADPELSLSAANGPGLSVAGGPLAAIEALERRLAGRGVACRRLQTTHAFHSKMMEPVVEPVAALLAGVKLSAPKIPFVSNVTGTWITAAEATDPSYWARHLRHTVRFAEGLETLLSGEEGARRLLVEVGPGQTLGTLARQHPSRPAGLANVASLRDRGDEVSDQAFLLESLGRLWLAGAAPDWSGFVSREKRRRVPLPTYPFERRRFFVDAPKWGAAAAAPAQPANVRRDIEDWCYEPVWERASEARPAGSVEPLRWLVLRDDPGVDGPGAALADRLVRRLESAGHTVFTAAPGSGFAATGESSFTLDPRTQADYRALFHELAGRGGVPDRIVHLWSVTGGTGIGLEPAEDRGFYSLLWLAQALGETERKNAVHLGVVADGLQEVTGGEALHPEKATLLGPCRVLPQEYPHLTCAAVDVEVPSSEAALEDLAARLAAELTGPTSELRALTGETRPEPVVALRGRHRWVRRFRPVRLPAREAGTARLRQGGVYAVTSSTGAVGDLDETAVALAEHLFRTAGARLALLVPDDAPLRAKWGDYLSAHDEASPGVQRLRRLMTLESEGCELLVVPVDIAHAGRVRGAVERIQERFGALHGVIHTAGETGAGLIQLKSRLAAAGVLAPKVLGTLALAEATRGMDLDFLLLAGVNASVTGGFGQVDTCAAAAFLDAYAWAHSGRDGAPFVQTVDWGYFRWQPVTAADPAVAEQLRAALEQYGISARELTETFDRALAAPLPQIVVSTRDLGEVMDQLDAFDAATLGGGLGGAHPGESHPRPDLSTPYVEPSTEVEKTIATIWQSTFGIEGLGANDNFFDLSGNSLLAIQIVTRVSAAFEIELTIASLLEAPTIAEMASRIAPLLPGMAPAEAESEMDRILREIEGLSPEEAEERLARELATIGGDAA
jgi:acyl transferase domain-containing protein